MDHGYDERILLAASIMHDLREKKKRAVNNLSRVIHDQPDGKKLIEIQGASFSIERMWTAGALQGISKMEDKDLLFLFLDVIPDTLRASWTYELLNKLFDHDDLMQALKATRTNWSKRLYDR